MGEGNIGHVGPRRKKALWPPLVHDGGLPGPRPEEFGRSCTSHRTGLTGQRAHRTPEDDDHAFPGPLTGLATLPAGRQLTLRWVDEE